MSGYRAPSRANEAAFHDAVREIAAATHKLLGGLVTQAPSLSREAVAERARARAAERFGADRAVT